MSASSGFRLLGKIPVGGNSSANHDYLSYTLIVEDHIK